MAIVMVMHWPEITAEMYEEACERVGWEVDQPDGGRVHAAWFEEDGLHIHDVWESAEQFERFVEERLMPAVKGELGFPGEPSVRMYPLHRQFVADAAKAYTVLT